MVGGQFGIDTHAINKDFAEVATLSDGNFVVVYQEDHGSPSDTDIRYALLTPDGTAGVIGFAVPGATGPGLETDPDVAGLRDGDIVFVWTDPDGPAPSDIRASIVSNTGTALAANILVNTTTAGVQDEASVVALADGGFLVTWEDDTANLVRAQRFDAAGNKIGTEFTVKNGVSPVDSPEATLLADGRIAYAVGDV